MLPILLKIRLTTMAMSGWTAAAAPVPMPMEAVSVVYQSRAASPIEVKLYDENLHVSATVLAVVAAILIAILFVLKIFFGA
jgi:hypothetical protein